MSRQIILALSTFLLMGTILAPLNAPAQGIFSASGSTSGGSFNVTATQERRSSERFNIIDWIRSNQAAIAAQNSRYGGGGRHQGPYHDLVLYYQQDTGTVTSNSATLGKDTRATGRLQYLLDDLISVGNRSRLLNIDLGVEGFASQTLNFSVDPSSTQTTHKYTEQGGGLLIRPFGRSSQDTGLIVKGGYLGITETGLWQNTSTQVTLSAPYLGAEVKLYLLGFLGLRGEYTAALETQSDSLQGKWKMQRFTYGAFVEFYLLDIGAYLINTEMDLTPSSGAATTKEVYNGEGLTASLYF